MDTTAAAKYVKQVTRSASAMYYSRVEHSHIDVECARTCDVANVCGECCVRGTVVSLNYDRFRLGATVATVRRRRLAMLVAGQPCAGTRPKNGITDGQRDDD